MKKKNILTKYRANLLTHMPRSYFESQRECILTAKSAVAKLVVEKYLRNGDSLILDAGSSSYLVAQEIARRSRTKPDAAHFTVMTHNYRAFETLVAEESSNTHVNTLLAGGRYDRDLNALFGSQTAMAYENFYPRVVIIAASGLVADIGLFCHGNTEELQVKELIFRKATRDRIILADHTKIGTLDALCFGRTVSLRANAHSCILVTDDPPNTAPLEVRDNFNRQIESLRNVYNITIDVVSCWNQK